MEQIRRRLKLVSCSVKCMESPSTDASYQQLMMTNKQNTPKTQTLLSNKSSEKKKSQKSRKYLKLKNKTLKNLKILILKLLIILVKIPQLRRKQQLIRLTKRFLSGKKSSKRENGQSFTISIKTGSLIEKNTTRF